MSACLLLGRQDAASSARPRERSSASAGSQQNEVVHLGERERLLGLLLGVPVLDEFAGVGELVIADFLQDIDDVRARIRVTQSWSNMLCDDERRRELDDDQRRAQCWRLVHGRADAR